MLFEGRLGGQVYRPIGEEWYSNGFWKIYDHPATVNQYLGIGGATPDGSPKLNEVTGILSPTLEGVREAYLCHDIEGDSTNKAITFDEFMRSKFDIVIASIPQHIEPFKRLCELHPNHPKLIYQIGNAWNIPEGVGVNNVMASAVIPNVPVGINFVSYHQEFDLSTFNPQFLQNVDNNIYSFVNCFNTQDHLRADWDLFLEVSKMIPGWNFKSFGGQCRDGNCNGSQELADRMREAKFIWHTKAGGDGYGHVLHNSAAVGKPIITKKSYYQGKMGERLMIDGETCINIDNLSIGEIIDKINYYNEPERYLAMCHKVYDNFKQVVDFDKEEQDLRVFLSHLQ